MDSKSVPASSSEPEHLLSKLRAELEDARVACKAVQEELRETLAAMIQHQQVGKCGNFRYNTVTGAIRGTEEIFKIFQFPPGTRGCSVSEWLAKVHPDDRERIRRQFFDALEKQEDLRFDYRIVLEDGEIKHIRCDGEPDLHFVGEPTYFGVLTDVTQRRAFEEAQRIMEAELATALRLGSIGELAGSIIHEVNQPLSAILADAEACRRCLTLTPTRMENALEALDGIVGAGERAAEIINGLKSLIRSDAAELTPFSFDLAVREVCSLLIAEVRRENVMLVTDFAPDLPLAIGNRIQIQQIVMNLARNAIEAMRSGTEARVLTITTGREGNFLSLLVSDTGPGYDTENSERLFSPLYTTKEGGMGLGLSISRKIAIAHGGSLLALQSNPNGAVFQLLIPVDEKAHG